MHNRFSLALAAACTLAPAVLISAPSSAQDAARLELSSQPLAAALRALGNQTKTNILFDPAAVRDLAAPAVTDAASVEEALAKILVGSGLTYRFIDARTVTLIPADTALAKRTFLGRPRDRSADRIHLAQASAPSTGEERHGQAGLSASEQAAQDPAGNAGRLQIEEVVVTATKRAENVQDVPFSIAVISGQDIERRGLVGMQDYLRSIPGVNQIDRGGSDNAIVIRGITTSPTVENFGSGATVATYFGETPITGGAGLLGGGIDVRPVDLERIEVLRGPQGTTYGSSSLGGTLRLIPTKPRLNEFGAKVLASYSGTSGEGSDNSMFQGVINIPIVDDRFAIRAVGYRYDDSGFYENNVGANPTAIALATSWGIANEVLNYTPSVGRMVSTGFRLAAALQVSEALDISVTALTQDIEQEGWPAASTGDFSQISFPILPTSVRVNGRKAEGYENGIDLTNLVLNYNLGWAALTSATSKVDGRTNGVRDAWSISTTFGGSALPDESNYDAFTQELRLASQLQGRFQFLAGLYYEDIEADNLQRIVPYGTLAPFSTVPTLVLDRDATSKQKAIFGEVSYALTETLTATVGGRYFDYDKRERSLREGARASLTGIPLGTGVPVFTQSSESDTTFKANLSYRPTDDSLLYASWSQGFRLGRPSAGLNPSCDVNPADGIVDGTNVSMASTRQVDSDYLDNYEIGGKFSFLDRRFIVDAAVYHIDWQGLPANALAAACNSFYQANAGAATSDGAEFQASLFVVEGLRLDFGAGYTKGELSQDVPAQVGWREGSRLPGSPKVNANLAAQYDFNVGVRPAFIRFDSFYTGSFYADLAQTPRFLSGDYITLDARTGVRLGSLSVELYGKNLTNEDEATWRGSTNAATVTASFRLRPRTIGMQLGYDF